jgi:hypothetical protein
MDMTDIDKEIANLKLPQMKPGKRVDYSVKHASLKVILSKALAALFFLAVALFAMYTVTNANEANVDFRVVAVMGIVYLALGAYVSFRLWNIEFIGWLALFFLAVALFAMYTVTNANEANVDFRVVAVMGIVYLALGAYVSFRLWNIEFIGWLALFYVSLAGIALPAISAYSRGIAIGTLPIMAVSIVTLAVLWLIGDLYRVKKFRDIFSPPR